MEGVSASRGKGSAKTTRTINNKKHCLYFAGRLMWLTMKFIDNGFDSLVMGIIVSNVSNVHHSAYWRYF